MNETTFSLAQILPALPEIYLTGAICALLMFDVFFGLRHPGRTATATLLLLAIGAFITLQVGQGARQVLFDGLYVADNLSLLLKLASYLFMGLALFYSGDYLARRRMQKGEYYVLALTALLGIQVMASAANLLTLYIGVELLSLSLYALVAFDRDDGLAAEAAMKYFVLGAIASGMLLFGMSLIYGLTGSLQLDQIAATLQGEPSLGLLLGIAFVVVAVAFKFGAVPFHMWVPDVYQGAPTAVTMLVASAPKLASFALAFRLLAEGLQPLTEQWTQMLAVVAVASLVVGNIVAIAQTNLRRMLGYSAIANVGFILLGFVSGTAAGYQAALYYTLIYVLVVLGAFGVILLASQQGFEADELDHYRGLSSRDPVLAFIMAAFMFSTAGIPPFVGFWPKLRIIESLLGPGYVWLAGIAVLMSVIGAFYYLRVVWLMYFEKAPEGLPAPVTRLPLRLLVTANAVAAMALGLFPNVVMQLVSGVVPLH
jgi:NADH-quinone oxidoreductase subunit N